MILTNSMPSQSIIDAAKTGKIILKFPEKKWMFCRNMLLFTGDSDAIRRIVTTDNVNTRDADRKTALHYAANYGKFQQL